MLRIFIPVMMLVSAPVLGSTKVVFLGDSLTEGYGVNQSSAYPTLIENMLKKDGFADVKIVNASISGSTSASAVSRLKWQLKDKPNILVLALGSNDGLRGLSINQLKKNVVSTIELAKSSGLEVILTGLKIPPNYGKKYADDFEKLFPSLANEHDVFFVPFLLEGVGGERSMNQSDGIHPNEKGHKRMADNVYPILLKVLKAKAQ
jgi:acyl-CoA thioesterase-1